MTSAQCAPQPFDLWGQRGTPYFPIVGESYHTEAIRSVVHRHGGGASPTGELVVPACLAREPQNPYDHNAVAVTIDGRIVGHLAKELAPTYHRPLDLLASRGFVARVAARVWWSGTEVGDSLWTSVTLDLAAPHLVVPVNFEPSGSRLLPLGRKLQLKEAPEALDHLASYGASSGLNEVVVWGVLAEHEDAKGKRLVALLIDGVLVGTLTPQSSAAFLPVVTWASQRGTTVACQAELIGNHLDVQVGVLAAKANELPSSWLAGATDAGARATAEPATPPDGWYPDPRSRHELSYWAGGAWTHHVCNGGVVASDPV